MINRKKEKRKAKRRKMSHKAKELEAQMAHKYYYAHAQIDKVSTDRLMASGVMLELTFLGGEQAIPPVVVKDGLSNETIEAIKKDLRRSFHRAIEFKPAGYDPKEFE